MKDSDFLKKYKNPLKESDVRVRIKQILQKHSTSFNEENLTQLIQHIDLTTLNHYDTENDIKDICDKANHYTEHFPKLPEIAAICVFPSLVEHVRFHLESEDIRIAAVAGGFPAAQTYLSIKVVEARMAIDKGADEIDMVLPVGLFLEGKYKEVFKNIGVMKEGIGKKHLKVILETGSLNNLDNVRFASFIAMDGNADFIKTSTGKFKNGASLEAVYVMADAIKDYYTISGRKVGIKPAGGIRTAKQAVEYMMVIKEVLGDDWLTPELFRIGASSLVNDLLREIAYLKSGDYIDISYY